MAATISHTMLVSPLTLAALEDSGWYLANYSKASALTWGRGLGCSFLCVHPRLLCFQPRLTCKLVRFLGHGQSTDPSNRSALSSSLDYAVLAGFGRGSPVSNSATVGSEESYESNDDEELF